MLRKLFLGGNQVSLALQRFVDSGLFNEKVAEELEAAAVRGESIIVAGDRSTGSRPLTAMIMGLVKKNHDAVQVRKVEDLEKEGTHYMILGIEGEKLEDLVAKALENPNAQVVTVKEAENPISVNKVLKQNFKKYGHSDRTFLQIELDKFPRNEDGVPFTDKLTRLSVDEKGKIQKENIEFK